MDLYLAGYDSPPFLSDRKKQVEIRVFCNGLFSYAYQISQINELINRRNEFNTLYKDFSNIGERELSDYLDLYLADAEKTTFNSNLNFNSLFTFLLKNQVDYYLQGNYFKGKLFIDSGAFTAWTKGIYIDVDAYIKWINDRSDSIDLYGQVDTIPGTLNEGLGYKDFENSAIKTWNNYLYMRPRMKNPEGLLYTFHAGEPIKYLQQALDYTDEHGNHIPYIALGGVVGNTKQARYDFFENCFYTIKHSSNPDVKVHAFGMTDFDLLNTFPIYSADSTSWIMVGAMGSIMSDYGNILVSDKQKNNSKHYSHLPKQYKNELEKQVIKYGYNFSMLSESRDSRVMYNAMYLVDKASKIRINYPKLKSRLF